jgi:hypothetical protein
MPKRNAPETLPASWDEWAQTVAESPGVQIAVAFDADGTALIAYANDDRPETQAKILHAMYRELNEESIKSGGGPLTEVRIEWDNGEVWVGRTDGFIVGFIGNDQLAFGAARRRALMTVARHDASGAGSADGSLPSLAADDTMAESTTPQAAPSRDRAGAGQGHDHDS